MSKKEQLEKLEAEYKSWVKMAYNASQMANGKSYGRCERQMVRLEKAIDKLRMG